MVGLEDAYRLKAEGILECIFTRVRDKRVKIDEICEVDKSKDGQWYDRL